MSGISVGEALREADAQVRALTFEASSFHAEGLIIGWAPFLTAALAVSRNLPGQPVRHDLQGLLAAWRWNPPPAGGAGHPAGDPGSRT